MPAVIFGRRTFWRQLLKANISNNSGRRLKADVVVAVAEVRRRISSKADILVIRGSNSSHLYRRNLDQREVLIARISNILKSRVTTLTSERLR